MKNVETTFRMVTACVLTSVTLAAVIVEQGAGSGDDGRPIANKPINVEGFISRCASSTFDDTVAIFDSTTAIAKYNGDLTNASTRGTWKPHVNGVKGTSGMLEIQRPKARRDASTVGTGVTNQRCSSWTSSPARRGN
jgi:hypothetical protein